MTPRLTLLTLLLLSGCVTSSDIKRLRCDHQQLADEIHYLRDLSRMSKPAAKNLYDSRKASTDSKCGKGKK